jgi:ubiquinone/menaquinone biosynthesis C-methylase UbiE
MFGATQHGGGSRATRELIELCHVDEGKHVLDVGCGVGITTCNLARQHGCTVVGVDIREAMINRARERAGRLGVAHLIEFWVADVQDLPFEEALFDAVLSESVASMLENKQRGICEYARVTKPGGYVGLNEMTWLKPSPPEELVDYYARTTGSRPETVDGWRQLLEGAGLFDVAQTTHRMNVLTEYIDTVTRFGLRDLMTTSFRFLSLAITSPAFRRFSKAAIPSLTVARSILSYLGYGLYVARK